MCHRVSRTSPCDVCLSFGRPPRKQQPGHRQPELKPETGARVHPATPLQSVVVSHYVYLFKYSHLGMHSVGIKNEVGFFFCW